MRFPDCMRLPNAENTFAGFPIAQTWTDLALWEEFLNRHPVASLVELGTWQGGMAAFLALQARARGIQFTTIDHQSGQMRSSELVNFLGASSLVRDIFEPGFMRTVLDLAPTPRLLFCDNGNKRRELSEIAPLLGPGDYVAVHDWHSEAGPEDIPATWFAIFEAECEKVSSLTRYFRLPASADITK